LPPELSPTNKKQPQTNSDKIESVNMNIIAGMLNALLGKGSNDVKYSRFEDQASIIDYLISNIKLEGISKRTLEDRFTKANQILKQLEN
jgi:hypothetical protein